MTNEELENLAQIAPPEEEPVGNINYDIGMEQSEVEETTPAIINFEKLENKREELAKENLVANLQHTAKGDVKRSLYNLQEIIANDPLTKGLFRFNEHNNLISMSRDLDYYKAGFDLDSVDTYLAVHISKEYELDYAPSSIKSAYATDAKKHRENPLKEHFRKAFKEYDGKSRLDRVFIDYLGAEDNELTVKMTRAFFAGLVHKVKNPNVKFDLVLDLVGGQGIGKTTMFEKLGGDYYTDSITSFSDKDSLIEMSKNLIVNDDEMAISDKTDFATLKSFITKRTINIRVPYAETSKDYPKGFVLVRTTNNTEYLRDKTGNRRFITMMVGTDSKTKNISEFTDDIAFQVLGEAIHDFGRYESYPVHLLPTPEETEYLQRMHQYQSIEEEQIIAYLESNPQIKWVTRKSLMENALEDTKAAVNSKLANKVGFIMNSLPCWEYKKQTNNGISQRGYERIDND